MPDIELKLPAHGWRPRRYQEAFWSSIRDNKVKRHVAVWHRRAGKDEISLHATAGKLLQRPGNYWHMLPEAAQARKAIWDAVNPHTARRRIDEAFPLQMRSNTREQEMLIKFHNGATWQVVGSDNYNSLVGSPPVGIVFSEWALADPSSWAYLRPILRENGGYAIFIYTPRGRNHGATIYEAAVDDPEWYAEKLTAEQTGVFSEHDLNTELREYKREFGADDGEARYRQEYLCDFNIAVVGSYYARQMSDAEDEGRITRVAHDPSLKTDTFWDLGHSDATAVWFAQRCMNEWHMIDYFEANGATLDDLARMLQTKREDHKYIYGRHIWPHDGSHRTLASGGRQLSDMMSALGFSVEVQPVKDVQVGIIRTRQMLPLCWFDREKCAKGLETLRNYHKRWDEKRKVFDIKPMHDWSSHGADALRTGAMAQHETDGRITKRRDRYAGDEREGGSSWAA